MFKNYLDYKNLTNYNGDKKYLNNIL